MHKRPLQDVVWCGIDVSATQLVVAVLGDACTQQRNFENRAAGHRALVAWLQRQAGTTQVCLEATGIYSLDLALALHAADRIAVSVLNPKIVCRFAETLRRSKTDTADAQVLAEYARRMPFLAWCPPTATALRLRAITRHLAALVKQHTAVSNQLHAAQASVLMPACVRQDLRRSLRSLERSRQRMRREGMELVQHDSELARRFTLLQTVPGIGEASALYLFGGTVAATRRAQRAPVGGTQRTGSQASPIGQLRAKSISHQPKRQSPPAPSALYARPGRGPPRSLPARLLRRPATTAQTKDAGPGGGLAKNPACHLWHVPIRLRL